MNREETIQILQKAAEELARKHGYTNLQIGEDRQKGIWGERLTEYLEKTYGECTKEIKWCDPDNSNNYVEFRFRFSDPVISMGTFDRGDQRQNMASLEYSDHFADWTHYDEERELPSYRQTEDKKTGHFVDYVHTGEFICSERQIWGDKGHDYEREIEGVIEKVKEKHSKDNEEYIDHKTYLQSYTEEEQQMFEDYLIKTELNEWKALYSDEKDGHTLTVENIKKFTDKAWQLWNSYSDDEIAKRFDKNGAGCEDVDPSLVDWEGLIDHIKSGKPGTYNLHQYADYGCIFLDLEKDGLSVSCPFPSGCLSEHLEEDLNNRKFTIEFINKAIAEIERDRNNGTVFEWDQEGCIDNTITELERDDV